MNLKLRIMLSQFIYENSMHGIMRSKTTNGDCKLTNDKFCLDFIILSLKMRIVN
jgi:hypothetical protein